MSVKFKTIGIVVCLSVISSCGTQGPGWSHAQPLTDGSGVIGYDCRPLEGEAATAALKKSHQLFESKFHKALLAHDKNVDTLRAQGINSQEVIMESNDKGMALLSAAHSETKAIGCEYKGILDNESAARATNVTSK